MTQIKTFATLGFGSLLLVSCGGGGGDSGPIVNPPPVATINVKAALSELLTQTTTTSRWESTTSSPTGNTATILAYSSSDALYGKQGSLIGPNRVTTIQLQVRDRTTVLIAKYLYQVYVDKTTGGVVGAVGIYNDSKSMIPCINAVNQSTVPTSASIGDSGAMIDGLIDFYEATFRAGTYAHYCQFTLPPAPLASKMRWSLEAYSSKNYLCINDNILNSTSPLTKFCIGVDEKGKLNQSMKAYLYNSQGGVIQEFTN
jgi:hypothetical protein